MTINLTEYQTKYYAYELTKRCPVDSLEKLAGALVDAQDEIDKKREELISEIERKLKQKTAMKTLFSMRWQMR